MLDIPKVGEWKDRHHDAPCGCRGIDYYSTVVQLNLQDRKCFNTTVSRVLSTKMEKRRRIKFFLLV